MAGEPARSLDDAHVLALEQLSIQIDRPRRFTYSAEFWDSLSSLHQQHGISLLAAGRALAAALILETAEVTEPCVELVNGSVRLTWSFTEVYGHAEFSAEGTDWFFRDHATGAYDGSEDPVPELLPQEFLRRLLSIQEHCP